MRAHSRVLASSGFWLKPEESGCIDRIAQQAKAEVKFEENKRTVSWINWAVFVIHNV